MYISCDFNDDVLNDLIEDYYLEMGSYITNISNEAYSNDLYGTSDSKWYELLTDINMLLEVLIMAYNEKANDVLLGLIYEDSYYERIYNVPCIKKYFKCRDVDVSDAIAIFI